MKHVIQRPVVLKPNVRVIDYCSLKMNDEQANKWMKWIKNNLPIEEPRSPWITVTYSSNRIRLPVFTQLTPETNIQDQTNIVIDPNFVEMKHAIFTDPYGTKHWVLLINSDLIKQIHQQHKQYDAVWDFEEYQPHITLESNTSQTEESIQNYPLPHFPFVFNIIEFSKFGEVIQD